MTTYKQLKHALLSNRTIVFNNPSARIQQMVTILHCAGIVSIVENVETWRVTLVREATVQPKATVADVDLNTLSALAVVSKPDNPLPFETKVHLWRNYPNGRKPSNGTFEVVAHYVLSKNGMQMECVDLLPATAKGVTPSYHAPFTVLRSQVCTEDEYAAYIGSLNPVAKAA